VGFIKSYNSMKK